MTFIDILCWYKIHHEYSPEIRICWQFHFAICCYMLLYVGPIFTMKSTIFTPIFVGENVHLRNPTKSLSCAVHELLRNRNRSPPAKGWQTQENCFFSMGNLWEI